MKTGGGKAKGSSFERHICKSLSLWMSHGKRDDLFWRSAMSGGRASVQFKKGKPNRTQTGDITAIDPLGAPLVSKFFIDSKFNRDLQLQALYTKDQNKKQKKYRDSLLSWWREGEQQAQRYSKFPMLIVKQNYMSTLVCLNFFGLQQLALEEQVVSEFPRLGVYILWYSDFLLHAEQPT